MITIICMGMVVNAAGFVVDDMCNYNTQNSNDEQGNFKAMRNKHPQHQEKETGCKHSNGHITVVVFFKAMPKRVDAHHKSQSNHTKLKVSVFNDV